MKLEDLVHRVEKRLVDMGKRLLPGGAEAAWREEAERLHAELSEHSAHALHFRQAVEQLRTRLVENEVREAMLASEVETYVHTRDRAKAYQQAIELDHVRRQLAEDRARLPCEEKAYQMHRERIRDLERRLTELERKLKTRVLA
jgi:chromosome segregation ATPase